MKKISIALFISTMMLAGYSYGAEVRNSWVTLNPTKLDRDQTGLFLDFAASFDKVLPPDQKKGLSQAFGSVLADNVSAFDKSQLDVKFDQDRFAFRFRIEQSAVIASNQKSFSACVAQWFNGQTAENKARFNKAYLTSEDSDSNNIVKVSLFDYFSAHAAECSKLDLAFSNRDIQHFTALYVENKMQGKAQERGALNLANVYDQSFDTFLAEADIALRSELISRADKYFNSLSSIGLPSSASIDPLISVLAEQRPITAAKLLSFTLNSLLDSETLAEAFDALSQSHQAPAAFDKSLYWVNSIYKQCSKEYSQDPTGALCVTKLGTTNFYFLSFLRLGKQFKLLVVTQ